MARKQWRLIETRPPQLVTSTRRPTTHEPHKDVRLTKDEAKLLAWLLQSPAAQDMRGFELLEIHSPSGCWLRILDPALAIELETLTDTTPPWEYGWDGEVVVRLGIKVAKAIAALEENQE